MEYFDELAQDMDAWKARGPKPIAGLDIDYSPGGHGLYAPVAEAGIPRLKAEGEAAHDSLDAATRRAYRSALDCDDDPAPLPSKVDLDARIASLLRGIIDAQSLAVTLGDPRAKRLVEALNAMPGSGE